MLGWIRRSKATDTNPLDLITIIQEDWGELGCLNKYSSNKTIIFKSIKEISYINATTVPLVYYKNSYNKELISISRTYNGLLRFCEILRDLDEKILNKIGNDDYTYIIELPTLFINSRVQAINSIINLDLTGDTILHDYTQDSEVIKFMIERFNNARYNMNKLIDILEEE